MSIRILEVVAAENLSKIIKGIADDNHAIDSWYSAKNKDGRRTTRILVHQNQQQALMDELQKKLYKEKDWRIMVIPVSATIPMPKERESTKESGTENMLVSGNVTREVLYADIKKGTTIDSNFLLLVFLSTVVAAIGLMNDNVAVVIGAMVIAPLLGPNIALAFGAALGDSKLIKTAVTTNMAGLSLTLAASIIAGFILPLSLDSHELLSRTDIGIDGIILAFASGAAGVLSITTGLSATLVGVMVAVALMPPAVTMGLMLGSGHFEMAYGAALLLAANIICVNIAAQIMFIARGFKPRTWYMQKKSEQSVKTNIAFWMILFTLIVILIYLRGN